MESFLEILTRLYLLVYGYAFLLLAEWLEKGGFERIFKRPMEQWHFILVIVVTVFVGAFIPEYIHQFLGVALLFLWAGYKLHGDKSDSSNDSAPTSSPVSKPPAPPDLPPQEIAPPPIDSPPPRPGLNISIHRVSSPVISHWGYHDATERLYVRLRESGDFYVYCDVPYEVSEEFRITSSIDQYYNTFIKDRYRCFNRGYHEPKGPFEW